MKIIIPMTGYGSRFVVAGYKELKPLIKIHGLPVIEWIVRGMYKGESDFLFICRKEHLQNNIGMEEILKTIAPFSTIFAIDKWQKKGPVYDVLCAANKIEDNIPCIINYCDFYMTWDYKKFKSDLETHNPDGAIPCYTGYHPNLMPKKNIYASCKVDENEKLIEIREKYSFEKDKTKALHSPGVYYFKSGEVLKYYCQRLIEFGPALNGEFYASLSYNYMVKDGLEVWCPANVVKFCQWGTPNDMADYNFYVEHAIRWSI